MPCSFSDKYQRSSTLTKSECAHSQKFRAKWTHCLQFIRNESHSSELLMWLLQI